MKETLETLLASIEERAKKATPGPWNNSVDWEYVSPPESAGEDAPPICGDCTKRDSEFIAHARQDIPALLACLRKAVEQRNRYMNYYYEDLPLRVRETMKDGDKAFDVLDAELSALLSSVSAPQKEEKK